MARPWRLRHKLVLGLALVVGSVVLLLGGTLFGLSSYSDTVRTTERKIDGIQIVGMLQTDIATIAHDSLNTLDKFSTPVNAERYRIVEAVKRIRVTLDGYWTTLKDQTAEQTSRESNEDQLAEIDRIRKVLLDLDRAVEKASNGVGSGRLIEEPEVDKAYRDLDRISRSLFAILVTDVKESHKQSAANHRRSLLIAGFATVLAVVLVLTLLYYFRVWVFTPISQLQAGVLRVHSGDFDHPIVLDSQDELAELATEFNAMTTRLRDIYKDLASQVNERTRQLVRSERMVSVGFLAAGVAHEINNPLASIAFCAEALERRLQDILHRAPGEAEVILKYLKMMQDEAQRCKQITQKLLDFSRSGGRREPSDLTQLITDVIEVAQVLPNARNKRIEFQSENYVVAPVSAPDVKGVVLNMVVNALDSMEDGGYLTVELVSRGDVAEMRFADTGCGMTAETLEHIFEPFFTRNRTGNGTGLGLSISHQIIDQHGGSITASSAGPGKGSVFIVQLPLKDTHRGDGLGPKGNGKDHDEPAVLAFPMSRQAVA